MKALIFVHSLPQKGRKRGGVSESVDRIAEKLSRTIDVTVVCLNADQVEKRPYKVYNPIKNKLLLLLCKSRVGLITLYPILLNFLRLPEADVAHFHGEDWFLWRRPWPVVRTMHGSSKREREFTQNRLRKLLLTYTFFCEHLAAKFCDRLLCVGSETIEIYGRGEYIGNGYNPEIFQYSADESSDPIIFFNGWWKGRKRGAFVYQTFIDQILPVFPDAKLLFLADYCPDHPNVEFYNGISDEKLAELYQEASIFAYPSKYEGFGMAYIEAMASGAVVVTTDNPGARDVLDQPFTGIICEDNSFAKKILEVLQNQELRNNYREAAEKHVKKFTIEHIAQEHLKHYELAILSRK